MKNESTQGKEVRDRWRQTNSDPRCRTQTSTRKNRKEEPRDLGVRHALRAHRVHRTPQQWSVEPCVPESAVVGAVSRMKDTAENFKNVECRLREAASDRAYISGWTHNFYRYPARFSPTFAAAAINALSRPDDIVLDPYMGGGTAIVEALAAGRRAIGNDLNSLATFVTRVKTGNSPASVIPLSAKRAGGTHGSGENEEPEPPSCAVHKEDNRERSEHHYDIANDKQSGLRSLRCLANQPVGSGRTSYANVSPRFQEPPV